MTASLVEILSKTLAVIEHSDEFRQDEPAFVDLRRGLVRALAELEIEKAARSSGELTGSQNAV